MKNSAIDLNDYLFRQLDQLTNGDLEGDKLEEEVKRSKAIVDITKTIVENNRTVLEAIKLQTEYGIKQNKGLQTMIGVSDE